MKKSMDDTFTNLSKTLQDRWEEASLEDDLFGEEFMKEIEKEAEKENQDNSEIKSLNDAFEIIE